MSGLTLCRDIRSAPASGPTLLWLGRAESEDRISLENELERQLLQIRKEHMDWACATGLQHEGASLQESLECGDTPSMWWTSLIYERHPKLSPNLYPIYKLRCLELLLEQQKWRKLTLIGGEPRLKKTLARLCAKKGIEFEAKLGPAFALKERENFARRIYWLLPAPVRAWARFIYWQLKIRAKLSKISSFPELPQAGGKPAATIATYFPNIDLHAAGEGRFKSRYWEKLHSLLNEEAKAERPHGPHFVRWLFIRFPAPDLDFTECLRLRDEFQKKGKDGLSFNYLEEFLTGADIRASLARWLRLAIRSATLARRFAQKCHFENSDLNFWPWMREQWFESLAGWRCLERCLLNRAFRSYYAKAGVQRWTLFPLENCPWERMLVNAARQIADNGPIFGSQHSTVRPTDFRYFDSPRTFTNPACKLFQPDKIAGNGKAACRQWQANQMPPDRLTQVEALRYLYLVDASRRMQVVRDALPPQAGEPLEPGLGRKLLILTSFFADETEAQLELLKQGLGQDIFSGWRLVLKPHPYLMPDAWLAALPEGQRKRIFVSRSPLALELVPGTCVWASNSTTASLEAAIKGLPLMVMAASNDFDLCPIQDVPGLLRTATLAEVKRGLDMLAPPELGPDYLDLNPGLPAWRALLGLEKCVSTSERRVA